MKIHSLHIFVPKHTSEFGYEGILHQPLTRHTPCSVDGDKREGKNARIAENKDEALNVTLALETVKDVVMHGDLSENWKDTFRQFTSKRGIQYTGEKRSSILSNMSIRLRDSGKVIYCKQRRQSQCGDFDDESGGDHYAKCGGDCEEKDGVEHVDNIGGDHYDKSG